MRWLFSGPVAQVVEMLDRRGMTLPGDIYARILRSSFSREVSSLWLLQSVTMDGT